MLFVVCWLVFGVFLCFFVFNGGVFGVRRSLCCWLLLVVADVCHLLFVMCCSLVVGFGLFGVVSYVLLDVC